MERAEEKNFYELLGVERNATLEEIKQAFKDIVIVYHPDSNFFSEIVGDAASSPEEIALFKRITEAYQTLINKDKREEYDKVLNKTELSKGRQTTEFWIRPDGTAPKEDKRSREKQPTITDLQKYQQQYRERQMQKSMSAAVTVADMLEEKQTDEKKNIYAVFGVIFVVITLVIIGALLAL